VATETAPDTHPLVRERRIAVARQLGRRRLRRLGVVLGLGVVIGLLAWCVLAEPLDIDELTVDGVARLDETQVVGLADVAMGDPLLLARTGQIEDRLEQLPLVAWAEVDRDLPGRLSVSIREWEPAMSIPTDDGWALVDERGVVLVESDAADPSLPRLDAPALSMTPGRKVPGELGAGVAALVQLPEELEPLVDRITVDETGDVSIVFITEVRTEILLGRTPDLTAAYTALGSLVAQLDLSCAERVDLTTPSSPGIRDSPECALRAG